MQASPAVNAMLFILTGEKLLQADEDLAYESQRPFGQLSKRTRELSQLIETSVRDIAESMPGDVADSYVKAMSLLIDDAGKNHLREFGDQLDKIAASRVKLSMDIMEAKWQVIAEVIRLLIEVAFYMALAYFTGGASLSRIALAKARSRFAILATMSHLLQRTHLLPAVSEALSEAFTSFAVRLGMIVGAPEGRRPDGFDWKQIAKDGAFGAFAGGFTSVFHSWSKGLVKGYDAKFLKDSPDVDFKNGPNFSKGGLNSPGTGPVGGAMVGHHVVKETADFVASGSGEALAEVVAGGILYGKWETSWSTFVGAGVSNRVGGALQSGGVNLGTALRDAANKASAQTSPPPGGGPVTTVGGAGGSARGEGRADSTTTDGAAGQDASATDIDAGSTAPLGGVPSSSPFFPSSTGPTSSLAEAALWQQAQTGSAAERAAALSAIGELRGQEPPTAAEVNARAALHQSLANVPEVRVVSGGQSPEALQDTAAVRRGLEGLGPDVTGHERPGTGTATGDTIGTVGTGAGTATGDTVSTVGTGTETGNTIGTGVATGSTGGATGTTGAGSGAGTSDTGRTTDGTDATDATDARGSTDTAPGSTTGTATPPASVGSAGQATSVPAPPTAPVTTPSSTTSPAPAADSRQASDTRTATDGTDTTAQDAAVETSPTGTDTIAEHGSETAPDARTNTPAEGRTDSDTPGGPAPAPGSDPATAREAATGSPAPLSQPAMPITTVSGAPGSTGAPGAPPGSPSANSPAATGRSASGAQSGDGTPAAATDTDPTDSAPLPSTETRDGQEAQDPAAQSDAARDPARQTPPSTVDGQQAPLTVVVSDGPLPYGDPEAASRLLDLSGGDRAVVLGPPVAPQGSDAPGSGRPAHREAAVLSRERSGAPTQIRTVSAAPPAASDAAAHAFPDADVLLPLTDALTSEAAADLGLVPPPAQRPGTGEVDEAPRPVATTSSTTEDGSAPAEPARTESRAEERTEPPATAPRTTTTGTGTGTGTEDVASEVYLESGTARADGPAAPASLGTAAPAVAAAPSPRPAPRKWRTPSFARFVARPSRSRDSKATATAPVIRALDGHALPIDHVRRLVPDDATRPQQGRTVRTLTVSQSTEEDNSPQSEGRQRLAELASYRPTRTVTRPAGNAEDGSPRPATTATYFTGPLKELPGAGTSEGADYFVAHGTPRTVTLGTDDADRPSVVVSGVQLGEVLRAWGKDADRDRPLVLYSCETGRQPEVAGLPVAQHVANRTGRPVYAPTTEAGTAKESDGTLRATLAEGPDGPGEWRMFTPEPSGQRLEDLARSAGLHQGPGPVDAFALARTLQAVRTLRGALGTDAEQREDSERLISGLAFADGLRWLSPEPRYADARMTPALLRRMVADLNGLDENTPPTQDQYTDFLRAADGLREDARPDMSFDSLVPPPPPEVPPTAPISPEDVHGLAYSPSARVTWQLSSAPLPFSELELSPEDTATLLRRRPDLVGGAVPAPTAVRSSADETSADRTGGRPDTGGSPAPEASRVHADGRDFRRVPVPGDGDSFFDAVLTGAREQGVLPHWAGLGTADLRDLVRTRLTGSELADALTQYVPDPVQMVLDHVHEHFRGASDVADPWADTAWDMIAEAVLAGDAAVWSQLLRDSGYGSLLEVAPTPQDARLLGSGGLLSEAAGRSDLASSPFGHLLPQALAHSMDIDLRIVHGDSVTDLNPGGRGGILYVAYDESGHYTALAAAGSASRGAEPAHGQDVLAGRRSPLDLLRSAFRRTKNTSQDRELAALRAARTEEATGVPIETQLDRHRPPQLVASGAEPPARGSGPVVFEDGSRLPEELVRPGGVRAGGLMSGAGRMTLRGTDEAADQILARLPAEVRAHFDEAELRRLLNDEPSAFTAPRGATFVVRGSKEWSPVGRTPVGYEVTVEALPYHRWERFADPKGASVRLDTVHRGQASTGVPRSVGTARKVAAATTLGAPMPWMVKAGASFGLTRRTDYSTGTQMFNQTEMRDWQGSHLHLDDVYYQVRIDKLTPASAPEQSWRRATLPLRPDSGFQVRAGLTWRLQDTLTEPYDGPDRAPERIDFREGDLPRVSDTEAVYFQDAPESLVLPMSGVRPGSTAHRTLMSFLRPARLLGLLPRLTGQVVGPELTRGRSQKPLGHLIVERVVPKRATLVTEATQVELRDLTQTTYQNERSHVREAQLGGQVSAGPAHTLRVGPATNLRVQGGPVGRLDVSAGRTLYLGSSAARKVTGRTKGTPVALYRVEKTLDVRKPGQTEKRTINVVTLDWLPTIEARRLADWDARTPAQSAATPGPEPVAPPYLTEDEPKHLGHTRVERFHTAELPPIDGSGPPADPAQTATPAETDPAKEFAEAVVAQLSRSYPGLLPTAGVKRHPRLARLLHTDRQIQTMLHNERQIQEALNRPTLAQSLEALTTTGVTVSLTEHGWGRNGHHTLKLTADLDERQYVTSLSERSLRNSVIATQQSGQAQSSSLSKSLGLEVGVSPRDKAKSSQTGFPQRTGLLTAGIRLAWGRQRATRNTVAVTNEHLTMQTAAHLFSYRVRLNASFEGHRRPRGWARLASLGVLGAGVFVSRVTPPPLLAGDAAVVGRVELAVPAAHSSHRYAAVPRGPLPTIAEVPTEESADALIDGTAPRPTADPADTDAAAARELLGRAYSVLSVEGAPRRQTEAQEVAARASGQSWHVTMPGAPLHDTLSRASENLSVAGQIGQALGPFGIRTTGLIGAGPYQTHHVKTTLRARLRNLRVIGEPRPGNMEVMTGAERKITGGSASTFRTTVGLQGSLVIQPDTAHPFRGTYAAAGQYARGSGSSQSRSISQGRNVVLKHNGRMYPVMGDLRETVAVRDRWSAALGLIGTRSATTVQSWAGRVPPWLRSALPKPRPAAAETYSVSDAVVFHVPMEDAIEMGLAPDGLGEQIPKHLAGGYRVPAYLYQRFPTHASGVLDASRHAQDLLPRLEELGVPSHDRDQVLQMLSPDFLRAQLHPLTSEGVTLPVRHRVWSRPGDLPTGGSPGQVRFQLIPVTTRVERLRHGQEVEDIRLDGSDTETAESHDSGTEASLAFSGAPSMGKDAGFLGVGPTIQGTASGQDQSVRSRSSGKANTPTMSTTLSHAELVTEYKLQVTLVDRDGTPLVTTPPTTEEDPENPAAWQGQVGTLREHVSVHLLTPQGAGVADVTPTASPRAVQVLAPAQADRANMEAWRSQDSLPVLDDALGTGFLAVHALQPDNVYDALTLATGQADGVGGRLAEGVLSDEALATAVREARRGPLTALGTAPAQAQREITGQAGLTSGLRAALSPEGLSLPTLSSSAVVGQSHTAETRLYAKLRREKAQLLAVESKPKMEGTARVKESESHTLASSGTVEAMVGTAPMAGATGAGVITPGVAATLANTTDRTEHKGGTESSIGTNPKVTGPRSMLFSLPVSWRTVVEADHNVTDAPARAFGRLRRGPRVTEAESPMFVWVREDMARDLGLLDDTTFPKETSAAWDAMGKAQADMVESEKRYYDARARARAAWLDMTEAEREAALADPEEERGRKTPAVVEWREARAEALLWEARTIEAAAQTHRLHGEAARVTALHYGRDAAQTPGAEETPAAAPVAYQKPAWRSEAPAKYTVTEPTASRRRTLTPPADGADEHGRQPLEVHAVPRDGASFFHALIAAVQHGEKHAQRGPVASDEHRARVGRLHDALVAALAKGANGDLLAALAPDSSDTFTEQELANAGVTFEGPHEREFADLQALPETLWLEDRERLALATQALSRPLTKDPQAWDHGAADVLPALAARVLHRPVTVVTAAGDHQTFPPARAADTATSAAPLSGLTLFLADGRFHVALPEGAPAPFPKRKETDKGTGTGRAAGADAESDFEDENENNENENSEDQQEKRYKSRRTTERGEATGPKHPSYATPPWAPPTAEDATRYTVDRSSGNLTAPDRTTWTRIAAQPSDADDNLADTFHRAWEAASRSTNASSAAGPSSDTAPTSEEVRQRLRVAFPDPWTPAADRAMAQRAAETLNATVTLVEENGAAHTYRPPAPTGPGSSAAAAASLHVAVHRRGNDLFALRQEVAFDSANMVGRSTDPAGAPSQPVPMSEAPAAPGAVDDGVAQTAGESGAEAVPIVPGAVGSPSVQRAEGEESVAPSPAPSTIEDEDEDEDANEDNIIAAKTEFHRNRQQLWARINRITPLAANAEFKKSVAAWLTIVESDLEMALEERPDRNDPDTAVVDQIMKGFQSADVMGHQVNYMWFFQQQDTPGFKDVLPKRAAAAAEHGQIWSKMGAAEAISTANVGAGVALESSVQGYIFNGLGFGLPRWNDSPTMGELWLKLSSTYAQGLTNRVTAHVLDGIHNSSVLTTTEWPEAKKRIESGEIGGLDIHIYTAAPGEKRHELKYVETRTVRTQEEFDDLPRVPDTAEWRERQWQIDTEQKTALKEIYERDYKIKAFKKYVENIFGTQDGDNRINFRLTRTPHSTMIGTFSNEITLPDASAFTTPTHQTADDTVAPHEEIAYEASTLSGRRTDRTGVPSQRGAVSGASAAHGAVDEVVTDTIGGFDADPAPIAQGAVGSAPAQTTSGAPEVTVRRTAEEELVTDPRRFLATNPLSMDVVAGMKARWGDRPELAAAYAGLGSILGSLDRHWFVLTPDPRRHSPSRPAYLLTPALEKYVADQEYREAHTFLRDVAGHSDLPTAQAEGSYLHSAFVPYLRGGARDPATDVGHKDIPQVPGNAPGAKLVFTAAMNGCAFAVTASPRGPEAFRAWHYQSPGSRMADALEFQRTHATMDWFGDDEYMSSASGAALPEVTNVLSFGPNGWEVLGQEVLIAPTNDTKASLGSPSGRPLNLAPADAPRRFSQAGAVYKGLVHKHLGIVKDAGEAIKKRKPPKDVREAVTQAQGAVADSAGGIFIAGDATQLREHTIAASRPARVTQMSLRALLIRHRASVDEQWYGKLRYFVEEFGNYQRWLTELRLAAERLQ
ncbi:hypothetical protein [Streptomyces sp. V2I9]|uniref:hypothetical protein n=1 Tax=Streptomyces sp. V2I9 TaxID=3042304 RepID=UPI002786E8A3|nr:hypothetical protein [Streptomyces sp. V2I9]MDQ0988454.1 hypothetical protein [Streptomyces sp. V2I9]